MFANCIYKPNVTSTAGAQHNLYVRGQKGTNTQDAGITVTDSGSTYRVFTITGVNGLQATGLGYIVRWRVANRLGTEYGQWRTPAANWPLDVPDPAIAGIPFWRTNTLFYRCWSGEHFEDFQPFATFLEWESYYNSKPAFVGGDSTCFDFFYAVEFQVRYVMLVDVSSLWNSELDAYSRNVNVQLAIIHSHPKGWGTTSISYNQTFQVNLQPWGTCTTPSVDPVHFGMLTESEIALPGDGSSWKPLTLEFKNCPRVPIGYFLHANGKWVDKAQGIVGLPGSSPNGDPVVGNPRGFGIQIAHDNDVAHGNALVQISAHDGDADKQIYAHSYAQRSNPGSSGKADHLFNLRARVVRTHPANVPLQLGSFNTSVIFVIQYP